MLTSAKTIAPGHRFFLTAAFSLAVLSAVFLFTRTAQAQDAVDPVVEERTSLTAAELDDLVGPIALYPDNLVSIVLPASTYPLQIVQAARYLEEHETDPTLKPSDEWDDSVVALLNYPEVIELMNADIDWTRTLGEAAVYQQPEVLDAIQAFRERAYAAGNLESDERQVVTKKEEIIIIEPADPKVIYVPYYEPDVVVVRHVYPVYRYYPRAYPVYYYPYPYGHSFVQGLFWGVALAFTIDWHSHHVHVYHRKQRAHPYYGRYYHSPYYRRHTIRVGYRDHVWRPRHHHRFRLLHAAARAKANRRVDAALVDRVKHRRHDDRRFHAFGGKSAKRANKSDRIAHRREKAAFGTRERARNRNESRIRTKDGARHFDTVPGTRRAGPRTATAPREREHSNRTRSKQRHSFAGSGSNQLSRRQSKWTHVSKRRKHSAVAARVSPPARHGTRGSASRGTRSFAGAANNVVPRLRSNPGRRVGPDKRSGARARSVFKGGSGFRARSRADGGARFSSRSRRHAR